jgi:hypothetical protein
MIIPACELCDDEGWLCDDHPELSWDSWHQANGCAGKPCICNPAHEDHLSQNEKQKLKEYDEEQELINKFKK